MSQDIQPPVSLDLVKKNVTCLVTLAQDKEPLLSADEPPVHVPTDTLRKISVLEGGLEQATEIAESAFDAEPVRKRKLDIARALTITLNSRRERKEKDILLLENSFQGDRLLVTLDDTQRLFRVSNLANVFSLAGWSVTCGYAIVAETVNATFQLMGGRFGYENHPIAAVSMSSIYTIAPLVLFHLAVSQLDPVGRKRFLNSVRKWGLVLTFVAIVFFSSKIGGRKDFSIFSTSFNIPFWFLNCASMLLLALVTMASKVFIKDALEKSFDCSVEEYPLFKESNAQIEKHEAEILEMDVARCELEGIVSAISAQRTRFVADCQTLWRALRGVYLAKVAQVDMETIGEDHE